MEALNHSESIPIVQDPVSDYEEDISLFNNKNENVKTGEVEQSPHHNSENNHENELSQTLHDKAQQYLKEHKIQDLVENMMAQLVFHRPGSLVLNIWNDVIQIYDDF